MTTLGYLALLGGLAAAIYGAAALLISARRHDRGLETRARRAVFAVGGLVSVSGVALLYALVTRDFSLKVVTGYTSRDLPLFYTAAAFWAGQEGSMLLWAWLLAAVTLVVATRNRGRSEGLTPYALAVLLGTEAFFLTVLAFASNPFARLATIPPDGRGLNPLLRNPGMIFHPVATYLGYVGFTVPFAFGVAALVTGRLDAAWLRRTRRWNLAAWLFLSLGIGLGANWAYMELGWGGYWAWDPVENASLMPWLTATAFIHSAIIQERRGMLKVWNLMLIMLTFALTLLGTFITRSGIISSVHAFGVSTLAPYFLGFLALTVLGFLALLFQRWPRLQSENMLEGMASREFSFLLNNLLLTGGAFAVLWGTLLPLGAEALAGESIAVSAPYFNQVAGPIFLAILLLLGVCPLLVWRRTRTRTLIRHLVQPAAVGLVGAGGLFALGVRDPLPLTALTVCAFALGAVGLEFWRAMRARRRTTGEPPWIALWKLLRRQPRRYGGYLAHLGILLVAVGIVGSSFYQTEATESLRRGESMRVGAYRLEYAGLDYGSAPGRERIVAKLNVYRGQRFVGTLEPEKGFYANWPEPSTEVDVRSTLLEDLYIILASWEEAGQLAVFKVVINPLVIWIWIGGGVLMLGTVAAAWPARRRVRVERRYREDLLIRRDAVYAAIKELDLDRAMDKIASADYRALRHRYTSEAVAVLQELDAHPAKAGDDRTPGPRIEQETAPQGRGREDGACCARCGLSLPPGDRFCRRCGAALGERPA